MMRDRKRKEWRRGGLERSPTRWVTGPPLRRLGALLLLTQGLLLLPGRAAALPATVSRNSTTDDATVTLTIWDQMILGDARSFCTLRVQASNSSVAFKAGDSVDVWVKESDPISNDLLWHDAFVISAAEQSAGVDRSFDCAADFLDDTGSTSEIYGEALVTKAGCGTFCLYDDPATSNIDVAELVDDSNEEDDNFGASSSLVAGTVPARIAKDADWWVIDAAGPLAVDLVALHDPLGGALDLGLYDSGGSPAAASVVEGADRSTLSVATLAMGTWYLRVMPRVPTDFNFYDLQSSLNSLATACTPGETGSQPCGRCGSQTRDCDAAGAWSGWGSCAGQGVCAPGETISELCGNCGGLTSRCDDSCRWVADAACANEGACAPGAAEERACNGGGTQTRACEASCAWGAYGDCVAPPLGIACAMDADCGTGLYCATEGGLFPSGYCTQVGCSSDADCAPGLCVESFGQHWCLAACPVGDACRSGYLCELAGGSAATCRPPCREDLDCWGQSSVCGSDGLCTGPGAGGGDGGSGSFNSQGGCGCQSSGPGASLLALSLLLLSLPRRWRRLKISG